MLHDEIPPCCGSGQPWAAPGNEGSLVSAAKASAPSPDGGPIVEVKASVALNTADGSHNKTNRDFHRNVF